MGLNIAPTNMGVMMSPPQPGGTSKLATPDVVDIQPEDIEDTLARYVRNCFIEAELYRRMSGVEERMLRALRARRYVYDPEDQALVGNIDVYIGLTALKCRAAEAWINDILLSATDKPFTLSPTPIPDLPDWIKEQVVDALELELSQAGVPMDIRARAKQLKDAALKYAKQRASDAVEKMETKINDQQLKGHWREAFGEFIQDFTTFPVAILRAPVIENVRKLEWDGNKVVEKVDFIYGTRRISPFDAYPAMESTTPRNGRYFIERRKIQFDELYLCLGMEGFNDETVRALIEQYRNTGFEEILRPDFQRKILQDTYTPVLDRKTLDMLIFNGKIQGDLLLEHNVLVPDAQAQYEAEIWTVNNKCVRAVLNPYPLQERPLYGTSFVKVPGAFWGEGLADILRDTQRVANSCARAIVRNMGYSSGPLGEVDVERLTDGQVPDEVAPYKLYHTEVDPTGKGNPAYRFFTVPNTVPGLMQVWDKFQQVADDLSGVPPYVLGNAQIGGAGRTMGGLSMLMANAAKGIKNSILNVDRDVIEPAVTFYYNMNMKYDDDPDIKADAQVVARGATGLLQRELSQARTMEILQTLTPYATSTVPGVPPLIPAAGMQLILREVLKTTGLPVDQIIPNPDQMSSLLGSLGAVGGDPQVIAQLIQSMAGGSAPSGNAMLTGSSTSPALDGRSMPPNMPGTLPAPTAPNVKPSALPVNMPSGA